MKRLFIGLFIIALCSNAYARTFVGGREVKHFYKAYDGGVTPTIVKQLTNKQYVDRKIASEISVYVPYVGATDDVDLGSQDMSLRTLNCQNNYVAGSQLYGYFCKYTAADDYDAGVFVDTGTGLSEVRLCTDDGWSIYATGVSQIDSLTDGTATLTGGNLTDMGNITGSDVDISAGTGDFTTAGDIGIGIAPTKPFHLQKTLDPSTDPTMAFFKMTTSGVGSVSVANAASYTVTDNNTSGTQYQVNGMAANVSKWGAATTSNLNGGSFAISTKAGATGDITASAAVSGQINIGNTNTATIGTARNFYAAGMNAGDGTISNGYHFYGRAPSVDGGTFTKFSHIWLEDATVAGTNYGIVVDSDTIGLTLGAGQDVTIFSAGTTLNMGVLPIQTNNAIYFTQTDGNEYIDSLNDGYVDIGATTGVRTLATLMPRAGTAAAGTAPIKFISGVNLTTPESGTLEYDGCKLFVTNVDTRKAIDRTSDVALETVTCSNTTVKTLLFTAPMVADSLCAGNIFKFHCDGIVSSDSSGDTITITGDVNDIEVFSLTGAAKKLEEDDWHIDANSTQRTIGANGQRAFHFHFTIDEVEVKYVDVVTINTTQDMTIKVYAQWNNADVGNILHMYQAWIEYKN